MDNKIHFIDETGFEYHVVVPDGYFEGVKIYSPFTKKLVGTLSKDEEGSYLVLYKKERFEIVERDSGKVVYPDE